MEPEHLFFHDRPVDVRVRRIREDEARMRADDLFQQVAVEHTPVDSESVPWSRVGQARGPGAGKDLETGVSGICPFRE